MRVAVVGGKLQGVEACYLAKKAGWEVVLIDKKPMVPAAELCDEFIQLDVNRLMILKSILQNTDLIIPALENDEALGILSRLANYLKIPIIYDGEAYNISSSKIKSNSLFVRLGVPTPVEWPGCCFPVIAKPSSASGSEGVVKLRNYAEFVNFSESIGNPKDWVIEEYLEGPSYSIEVLGFKGTYRVLQITELLMDADYDCKRVLAPVVIKPELREQFVETALAIARSLNLNGIMDVETILHGRQLKVLEIDARLPSQTPTAVYQSTGINMLEVLGKVFTHQERLDNQDWSDSKGTRDNRGVVYEHINISNDILTVAGEHLMADAGPLHLENDFYGADEAITNYAPGKKEWVATLIITGSNRQSAWDKRCEVIRRIYYSMGIKEYNDQSPALEESKNLNTKLGDYHDEIA